MTDDSDFTSIPQAESVPNKRARLSIVWIIPILAAVVGIGIAIQQRLSEGPTIRIAFRSVPPKGSRQERLPSSTRTSKSAR